MGNTITNFSFVNGVSVTRVSSRNGQTFPEPFSFTIDTTLGDGLAQFTLPLQDRTLNAGTSITVDWGDGNYDDITAYNDAAATHSYASGGTYDIRIWGVCGWQFSLQTSSAPKMTVMTSYGDGGVTILSSATNMTNMKSNNAFMSNANVCLSMIGWTTSGLVAQNVNATGWCALAGNGIRSMSQTATETVIVTSTNTAPLATFTLYDSGANFTTSGVSVGDIVRNTTNGTLTSVKSVDSANQLTLGIDIFTSAGDSYTISNGYDGVGGKAAYDTLIASVSSIDSGTNTSIATSKLIDTGADFVTSAVQVGDYVVNVTSEETALVTAIDSPTQLSLNIDIFKGSPANYRIDRGYGWVMTGAINWTA